MSPSSTIDLDRSIPVMVRREEPPPSGPPPQLAKTFILIAAVAAAEGALLLLALHPDKRLAAPVSLGYLVVSVAGALCWRSRTAWHVPAIACLFFAAALVMGFGAWRLRWGLTAPSLPMVPLLVCALTTVGGWRSGAVLAAVSALMLWLVSGVMPPNVATPGPGGGLLLVVHLLGIAVAQAAGVGLGRIVSQAVQTAHKRELPQPVVAGCRRLLGNRRQLSAGGRRPARPRAALAAGPHRPWRLALGVATVCVRPRDTRPADGRPGDAGALSRPAFRLAQPRRQLALVPGQRRAAF
jgi:hypothetical protein